MISFSGGETSAFMTQWLLKNKSEEYDFIVVFSNTGQENEETLSFVHYCDIAFNLNVVWLEAVVHHGMKKGTTYKVTDYHNASRNGEPFEEVIKKYGIPNRATPHCTREMKQVVIQRYGKDTFGSKYYTAIGIRNDEVDRVNSKWKEKMLIYPLITDKPMTKPKINFFWSQQPVRLNLKGYQGNCMACWKKSANKLLSIAKENPEKFDFALRMESKYGDFIPESRLKKLQERGIYIVTPITFFNQHTSALSIIEESRKFETKVLDDSLLSDETESCDLFSNCGDL